MARQMYEAREFGRTLDEATRLLQRALEEQGYLVTARWGPRDPVGTILPCIESSTDGTARTAFFIPGPMIIVAEATYEEWEAQRRRYLPVIPRAQRGRPGRREL